MSSMALDIQSQLTELLRKAGVQGEIALGKPPRADMGDVAFACFTLAKEQGKKPNEIAEELAEHINTLVKKDALVQEVKTFGPYVNFFLNPSEIATALFKEIEKGKAGAQVFEKEKTGATQKHTFGSHTIGKGKTVVVEYACPNPMKVFHLGHLRNLITGEAVVRMFENAGYDVKRVNYQGDVGMHIAKSLWGLSQMKDAFEKVKNGTLEEQVSFLGKAYAHGATKFEEDEQAKQEILEFNKKVYERSPEILDMYKTARAWSLEYFDTIYAKLGSHFDRLYFESEVFEIGKKLVEEGLEKGIFKFSEGAVIFEGSTYGLHDRVFINSQGFPTYEAKDMGLGKLHFSEYKPDQVIHVVGKEQADYFKVVFKALAALFPKTEGKEYHLVGGYLQLKGEQKMSSRKGRVIAGDELIRMVEARVREIMKDRELESKEEIARKVAIAALKYSMLKVNASQDIAFDVRESISTSGDSGPYLLYIVTRIQSLLEKAGYAKDTRFKLPKQINELTPEEKELILTLSEFPEHTKKAAQEYDPSIIAKYIYALAQTFNSFYQACPVLEAEENAQKFRIQLIKATDLAMRKGLDLLGIETVSKM